VTTATNKPASGNNANGVITFTTNHGSQYGKQIAFVDNDDLYIRRLTGYFCRMEADYSFR
jgi:hypothetical protein